MGNWQKKIGYYKWNKWKVELLLYSMVLRADDNVKLVFLCCGMKIIIIKIIIIIIIIH